MSIMTLVLASPLSAERTAETSSLPWCVLCLSLPPSWLAYNIFALSSVTSLDPKDIIFLKPLKTNRLHLHQRAFFKKRKEKEKKTDLMNFYSRLFPPGIHNHRGWPKIYYCMINEDYGKLFSQSFARLGEFVMF